jgi:hypothetical protein
MTVAQLVSTTSTGKFRYRPITFGGKGIRPGLSEGNWEAIRDMAYGMDEASRDTSP